MPSDARKWTLIFKIFWGENPPRPSSTGSPTARGGCAFGAPAQHCHLISTFVPERPLTSQICAVFWDRQKLYFPIWATETLQLLMSGHSQERRPHQVGDFVGCFKEQLPTKKVWGLGVADSRVVLESFTSVQH